jgi:hypothetical protein
MTTAGADAYRFWRSYPEEKDKSNSEANLAYRVYRAMERVRRTENLSHAPDA